MRKILLALPLFAISLSACCGCTVVSSMMTQLENTVKASTSAMDQALSSSFNISVKRNDDVSNEEALLREQELAKSLAISKEIDLCFKEIDFILEQTTNIEGVSKSMKLTDEFNNENHYRGYENE